jgi:hypothetical protein
VEGIPNPDAFVKEGVAAGSTRYTPQEGIKAIEDGGTIPSSQADGPSSAFGSFSRPEKTRRQYCPWYEYDRSSSSKKIVICVERGCDVL